VFRFVSNGWQNRAKCLHQVFVTLGKSPTEILETLPEAFGDHSLSRTAVFEWRLCSKACRVSHEDTDIQGDQTPAK
jgi:hypothetical protein